MILAAFDLSNQAPDDEKKQSKAAEAQASPGLTEDQKEAYNTTMNVVYGGTDKSKGNLLFLNGSGWMAFRKRKYLND